MYALGVRRDFVSRHKLIGGNWGAENEPHSHRYLVELQLEASALNHHGYLVDIVDVEQHLTSVLELFRDRMLNDQPQFLGLNPSLENFARMLAELLLARLELHDLNTLRVVLWESDAAWASYSLPIAVGKLDSS